MSIQDDHPERHQGAHPPDAGEPRKEMPPLPRGAQHEGDRSSSASATMNGRFTDHAVGRPAPADLSQYRAGRARGRAGNSERTETPVGLALILDALRAVVRDEFIALRRDLATPHKAEDEILTMAAVAKLLRVSSKTVLEWIRTFGLPGWKVGRGWRFRRSEVVRWIGEHHVC